MRTKQHFKLNHITYPVFTSEFEIQAELYSLLKPLCDVRGEVRAICDDSGKHKVRLDLVVFYPDKTPAFIIETKNTPGDCSFALPMGRRQDRRYSKFGVTVLRCGSPDQFDEILNWVESEMESFMAREVYV